MKCIAFVVILVAAICVALAAETSPGEISYNKSVEYFIAGSYVQALESINNSLDENPFDNAYWNLKVQILLEMRKFDTALSTLVEALQANSSNSQAWNDRGLLEAGYLHDYDSAIRSFNRSIKIDPSNAKTYYNKGIVLAEMGKYNESLQPFQEAINISSSFAKAWNQKGRSYSALKQYDKALKCFEKATQLDKANKDAWTNKGNALKALNREAEAKIAFSMAGN
jgi:tetratricopeptide (TPR) repeat protein